ncbi:phospho-sugar mutase [Helicobacter enhydrae]|uniref:Phospho-sugar mutase n=1 Tax=Helicobacter enhydrae TaxID=222136 RepID=A0A1B1U4N8_9HELI|nr:phosphomannomutase/phosphoglucomutase [Helicobacter enhydrae]ANV97672.1 phospho-sugar mutase [Helicobacter enhydrae]
MQKEHIFREYDIRGIFDIDLDQEIVTCIGERIGALLKDANQKSISIGYDARVHSKQLFEWLTDGLHLHSIKINDLGLIPTPTAYFATFSPTLANTNSIMITGSHNPKEYNGFKITLLGKPFYGQSIQALKNSIAQTPKPHPTNPQPKAITQVPILEEYQAFLIDHFQTLRDFPHPIAIDCGNGVAGVALIPVLQALNIDFVALYADPDGDFPNHHPDPSEAKNLQDLKRLMHDQQIPIGLAFDGDADRIALLSTRVAYQGDELTILFAHQIAQEIAPQKPIIIGEVKCSSVMYDEIDKIGTSVMYKTGHSNLKVKLKELNASFAGEMSGHLFFNDRYFGYDDGIYAGLRALELFLHSSIESVEEQILSLPKLCSTPEEKIPTTEDKKFQIIATLQKKLQNPNQEFPKIKQIIDIDGIRVVFENGWALIRASNTTPVLVTRFEAKTQEDLELYKAQMLSLIEDELR